MFAIKEIVLSVENKLILPDLSKSDFCLTSPNIQSEVGKQGSAIGCSADMSPNGSYFRQYAENINKRAACNDF